MHPSCTRAARATSLSHRGHRLFGGASPSWHAARAAATAHQAANITRRGDPTQVAAA